MHKLAQYFSVLYLLSHGALTCAQGLAPTGAEISVLEVPFELPLRALSEEAERAVPLQAGHWGRWRDWHGIDTQYRAWRGPLALHMSEDTLLVQAHVRYWVKARKKVLDAFELGASCGVGEAPRQAIIGLQMRLAWHPDWTLHPEFRLLPTRFLDRCQMTVADIDVTPLVGEVFRQQMRESLRAALGELQPRLARIRQQAEDTWLRMQEPIEVGAGYWLQLRPAAAAFSPLRGRGGAIRFHLGIALQPRLMSGEHPSEPARPLPPLLQFAPRPPGLRFRLALAADYAALGRRLLAELADQAFEVEGHRFAIAALALSGQGSELSARLRLTGEAAGQAEVWANLSFDPAAQRVRLTDLDFVFDPDDSDAALLGNLFYQRIQSALSEATNAVLQRRVERLRDQLSEALARSLPAGTRLDLSDLRLTSVQIELTPGGIRLQGTASGQGSVSFR